MASVGAVHVKVLPDLSEFEPTLREYIQRVVREELEAAFLRMGNTLTYLHGEE